MRFWLAMRREELGLTQVQAAELAGVSRETYRMAEVGERQPNKLTRHKISRAFDLPIEMWNENKKENAE